MTHGRDGYQKLLREQPNNSVVADQLRMVMDDIRSLDNATVQDNVTAMREFLSLDNRELQRFADAFRVFDVDLSGTLSLSELFTRLDCPLTPFVTSLFGFLDSNGDGELDFGEFLHAVGTVCMMGQAELGTLCWSLLDVGKVGSVTRTQFEGFILGVHGGQLSDPGLLKKTLRVFNTSPKLSQSGFERLTGANPPLLYPVFRIQREMRARVMGDKFWRGKMTLFQAAREKARVQLPSL